MILKANHIEPLTIVAGTREMRETVALWLLKRVEYIQELPGGYEAIGVARGTNLVGACLFTDYRPCPGGGSLTMWAAGHGWISRRIIREMLGYPFNPKPRGLGCHRITALIGRANKPSRKMVEDLGFVQEGKIRRGLSTTADLMVYGLLREECRWLNPSPVLAALDKADRGGGNAVARG